MSISQLQVLSFSLQLIPMRQTTTLFYFSLTLPFPPPFFCGLCYFYIIRLYNIYIPFYHNYSYLTILVLHKIYSVLTTWPHVKDSPVIFWLPEICSLVYSSRKIYRNIILWVVSCSYMLVNGLNSWTIIWSDMEYLFPWIFKKCCFVIIWHEMLLLKKSNPGLPWWRSG